MSSDYEQIRRDNIREYGEGTKHLAFLGRLYSQRTHFIFELLQNAEDAGASKVVFQVFADRLEVRHDGRIFTELDVRGICGVGEGTKEGDLTQIGKFGIGFKSVYAYTKAPEIHSGDEHFIIEDYVRPSSAVEIDPAPFTTLFIFPFCPEKVDPFKASEEINQGLKNLSRKTLIFLRNIEQLEYVLTDGSTGIYLRQQKKRSLAREVTILGESREKEFEDHWLVFEKDVPLPNDERSVLVEIAFKLQRNQASGQDQIVKISHSPLVAFFPTEKMTRLGFLIQGPYRTTPARDNVPKEDSWNMTLILKTGALIAEALHELKKMNLLTMDVLECLPINLADFSDYSMFSPISDEIRRVLRKEELLPAEDGTFLSAERAKIARGTDLRELLNEHQLRSLVKATDTCKWLSSEITEKRAALHKYITDELKVEEITPRRFASLLTDNFLADQDIAWMISFYRFLRHQEALWSRSRFWNRGHDPVLLGKSIIRLQDGTHVVPFREDGQPNAYLGHDGTSSSRFHIVHGDIASDWNARSFLEALGIPELDVVEQVIDAVLPKYDSHPVEVTEDQYSVDFDMIVRALSSDCGLMKKERLRKALWEKSFLRTKNASVTRVAYVKPFQAYFPHEDLRSFFEGFDDAWFIDDLIGQECFPLLKQLGVADEVRIHRTHKSHGGFVTISEGRGFHVRGIDGFDPSLEVHGLEHALSSPSVDKSAYIWNQIVLPNSKSIRGVVEESRRKSFDESEKSDRLSKFGRILMVHKWLPHKDGGFYKPEDLSLEDLPDSFARDTKVADKLWMKRPVVASIADQLGVSVDDLECIKQYPEAFSVWKASLARVKHAPVFPERNSHNVERRQERVADEISAANEKTYEVRERHVRVRGAIDPRTWLKTTYTNDEDQMICQICKLEMPFRKRDGEPYFEAVEALNKEHFEKEHESQYLALCPVCAARYKEFVKNDDAQMELLKKSLLEDHNKEIVLVLGDLSTTVRFVETHLLDIRVALRMTDEKVNDLVQ